MSDDNTGTDTLITRARESLRCAVRGLALSLLGIVVSLLLFLAAVLSLAFISLGVGLLTTPLVLGLVREHAERRRGLAQDWSGVLIPSVYRPLPGRPRPGITGQLERCVHLLRDPATWRDLEWLAMDFTAGFFVALLPASLLAQGVFGIVLAAGVWEPIVAAEGVHWYAFVPVSSQFTANLAALTGLGFLALALRYGPALLRWHFLVTRALLGLSEKQALSQRVARLTETRHDAVDTSAAELRRIERDLHDGAQARLVAMGMSLGTIETLLDKDPEQARVLLAQARQNSMETLNELRDLVHGIHPPVLAERGLADAVRALALRSPLPVEVVAEVTGRIPEPVESAAYFAVSEALTNAAKHSGAERIWVDLTHHADHGTLRISVTDDGRGDADAASGSGLRGLERRLAAFDGVLAVSSPPGGPTLITMEIRCGDLPRDGREGR